MFVRGRRHIAVITVTLIFLLLVNLGYVNASKIEFQVNQEGVDAACSLTLYQNFTTLTFRQLEATPAEEEEVRSSLESSLKTCNKDIRVSNIRLGAQFDETSFRLDLRFRVNYVYEKSGKLTVVKLPWKVFNLSKPVKVAGVEVNRVGEEYIKPTFSIYSNPAYARIQNGTRHVEPNTALNVIGNLTMLDFRASSITISNWNRSFSIEDMTTSWTTLSEPRLNMTLTYTSENITKTFYGKLRYATVLSVPFLAYAEGDAIYYQPAESKDELLMLGITAGLIISTISLAVLAIRRRSIKRK